MLDRSSAGQGDPRWLLKALRETAHELESQLWGLDEDDLRHRENEDAWSLKEIAAHLRDSEQHFVRCLELLTYEDDPRLPALDADALVLERDYRDVDVYDVLEELSTLRQRAMNLLWTPDADDWQRSGRHPYLGSVTIAQLARQQHEHDLEHLWQARRQHEALAMQGASG